MRFLSLVLLVGSLAQASEIVNRNLPVIYASPLEVERVLEFKQGLAAPKKVEIQGARRSVVLTFSESYSNSCIAGNHVIQPLASLSNDRITVALGHVYRKRMCPMIYQPVLVQYSVVLKGLHSDSKYKVSVGTNPKTFKKTVKVK